MCNFISFAIGIAPHNHEKVYLGNLFSHSGIEAQHGLRPDSYAEGEWTESELSVRTAGRGEYDDEALLRASVLGRWPTHEEFLEYCYAAVDLNARDENGWTALHAAAAANGREAIVRALIAAGAEINARSNTGWTPLHAAAANDRADIVRALIAAGADVNARDNDGWTPLHAAAAKGRVDVVRALIDAGADVNARDKHKWTALRMSTYYGREIDTSYNYDSIASMLIAAGAKEEKNV